ncbi:MAG: Clp protease ClpP [Gammaproteobacteria bacterium]|nr:Clp protease ClpP [Gammaproteobacteria bacterium]
MSYYRIENRRPTVAEIRIDGVIGESWNEASTTAQRFVADLNAIQAAALHVYLNSPGGSLMDANVIMAALQRHPATVTVLIDGWALSAASLIAMAGQTVRMGERSLLMIHNPATAARGDARELRKAAEMLDKLKDGLVATYSKTVFMQFEILLTRIQKDSCYLEGFFSIFS